LNKTVVITQSNYIPWRGYFDMMRSADEVILLDCVQYTRRDWRNRNRIKTPSGSVWLTIPVEAKGRFEQTIDEARISDRTWASSHIRSIELAYRRARHFDAESPFLFAALREVASEPLLSNVNRQLLCAISRRLGITVPFRESTEVLERSALRALDPTGRLLALAKACGANRYLSGAAAKAYLNVDAFAFENIEVTWMDYEGYPSYTQLWGPFDPSVSVVDLLLNTGTDAPRFLVRKVER
jgi:hypothetical protein